MSVYVLEGGKKEVLLQFAVAAPPRPPPFHDLFELLMSIKLYFTFKTGCHILSFFIAVQQWGRGGRGVGLEGIPQLVCNVFCPSAIEFVSNVKVDFTYLISAQG